jgi:hypothetical protein
LCWLGLGGLRCVHINKENEMKIDLNKILTSLGLPLGLTAVFVAVFALFGVSFDKVLVVAGQMLGLQLLIAVLINVLKVAGVVDDGTAGKWNAAINLLSLFGIGVALGLNPSFDFSSVDAQLTDIAKFAALALAYIVQIAGTKSMHHLTVDGLGIKSLEKAKE